MSMIAESAKFTKIFKKSRGGSYCCVAGCHCTRDKCFGLGFFAIPREGVSKDQDKWRAGLIRSIGRSDKNFNPLKVKICSRHFEEKCIKKGLIPGSMPTRWMPEKSLVIPKTARPEPITGVVPDHQINGPFSIDHVPNLNVDFQTSFLRSVNKIQSVCSNYSDSEILGSTESAHIKNVQDTSSEMTVCKVLVAVDLPSASGENCKISTGDHAFCHPPTRLLETKGNHDKDLKPAREHKKNMHQFPLKVKGPVKRVPITDAGSSKIVPKPIKMKGNSETGMTSVPCEQSLIAPQLYRVVVLDELLKSYTLIPPAVLSTSCPGPLSLHEKGNHSSVKRQHQTWTATSDQHAAEFLCDVEVKQEVSSDQEGSPVLSLPLEVCAVKKHAVVEQPSHCASHQGAVTTNEACGHEIALLQPKCQLQSTRTLKKVLSSYLSRRNSENQDKHHINMINPAFIKKEPEDFETLWNAGSLLGTHNSESKTGTEINMAVSEESPSAYKLDSAFIKKESEDFDSSWNTPSAAQTNSSSYEKKMGTEIYPTGVYRNVHFAHLMTGDHQ